MKTPFLSPLDITLARNEFIKDYGLKPRQQREDFLLDFKNTDAQGVSHFSVFYKGQCIDPNWELEKRPLDYLSLNGLVHLDKKLNKNQIIDLLTRTVGITLSGDDIESVKKVPGGWNVEVSQHSLRFEGSFKIKNH